MLERDEHFPFNNLKEIHALHLCRIDMEKTPDVYDWLSFISSKKEEEFMLVAERNRTVGRAFARLQEISADESSRIIYEARLKEWRDNRAYMKTAEMKGIEKGIKKGKAEGRAEGKAEGRREEKLENAKTMKAEGFDIGAIARITGLTYKEIENI